jgi:hypothetical protein
MNRGMSRNAIEIPQLKNAHPQRNPDVFVERLGAPSRIEQHEIVKLPLVTQASKYDLRGQSGIASIERGGAST